MNTTTTRLTLASASVLMLFGPSIGYAQFSRGMHGPQLAPPGFNGPFQNTPSFPVPYLSTTVQRQNTLPMTNPPVSPFLGRTLFPMNGFYGGGLYGGGFYGGFYPNYGYGYDYGYGNNNYSPQNITVNYNNVLPEPYVAPRNFAVPEPLPNDHPNTARLTLRVPNGAEVYLQGKKVDLTTNTFESPDLAPGETYAFDVRVSWNENGKPVEEKRTLVMRAGERQSLQYLATPSTAVRVKE